VSKPTELPKKKTLPKTPRFSQDMLLELAKLYWKHLLITILVSLVIWIFALASPRLKIAVPFGIFLPTLYTIALAFIGDPAEDRAQAFSFSILIGFIFFIIITALGPYISIWLSS